MTGWTDPLIRHALRLDGAGAGLARDIIADLNQALADLDAELARRVPTDAPFTYARLSLVRPQLVTLVNALSAAIGVRIDDGIAAAADTSVQAMADAMERLKDIALTIGVTEAQAAAISFTRPSLAQLVAARQVPMDGLSWRAWGQRLADDVARRISSELTQAAALGEPLPKVRGRLEKVADLGRTSAERLARTALNSVSSNTNLTTFQQNSDVIGKVRFLSVLDSRTSSICMSLSGREWTVNSPDIVKPPRHPNCRSVLIPVTKSWVELFGPDAANLEEVPAGTQSSQFGQVDGNLTYEQWLKRQDTAFQKEALGEARYSAWKAGIPLSGMATYSRALTVQELRNLYPGKI
jgi:SPP1 gp7 family putative phage head morphogenesis protein